MHHIRLDDHGFTELCKSIRLGEEITLDGHDLVGSTSRIVISAEIISKLVLRDESGRLPIRAVEPSRPVDETKFATIVENKEKEKIA